MIISSPLFPVIWPQPEGLSGLQPYGTGVQRKAGKCGGGRCWPGRQRWMCPQDNVIVHILSALKNLGLGYGWEKRGSQGQELTVLICGLLLLPEAAVLTGITPGSSCHSVNAPLPTKASIPSLGEDTRVASGQEGPASVGGSRTSARSCGQVCEASTPACTLARTL